MWEWCHVSSAPVPCHDDDALLTQRWKSYTGSSPVLSQAITRR
jgi:hypothetical protein